MQCADSLRVQAYFDGELDAMAAAEIEGHCETCAGCRALLEELQQLRSLLRRDSHYATAPAALRAAHHPGPRPGRRAGEPRS